MYGFVRSRNYFAWRLLAAAQSQDERNHLLKMRAESRALFDPLEDLPDNEFVNIYRLTKEVFIYLCNELRELTNLRSTQRISLERKVLTALFFYATGSYQRPVGVAKYLSQKMCSVYIQEVTQSLNHPNMIGKYIKFPQTIEERQNKSQRFYMKHAIPSVIGAIDCSHFHIFGPPKEEEHLYFCRKLFYSLNVQMICDCDYKIIAVNAKFGGSNHDSFIWENSQVNDYMQTLHRNGETVWLLGDSGYPQRPWLMTPILNAAENSPEANYNDKHGCARVVIENVFGRLKNRWRCLCKDRVLHYKPAKCAQIIQACCVLYNIAIHFKVPEPESNFDHNVEATLVQPEVYVERPGAATTDLIRGRAMRQMLVRRVQ